MTSWEAISASPSTPISRPEPPIQAKKRGRAWVSDTSSTAAAASSAAAASAGPSGSASAQQREVSLGRQRLIRASGVERAPRLEDQRRGVLEHLLSRPGSGSELVGGSVIGWS